MEKTTPTGDRPLSAQEAKHREKRIQELAEKLLPRVVSACSATPSSAIMAIGIAEEFVDRCDKRWAPIERQPNPIP